MAPPLLVREFDVEVVVALRFFALKRQPSAASSTVAVLVPFFSSSGQPVSSAVVVVALHFLISSSSGRLAETGVESIFGRTTHARVATYELDQAEGAPLLLWWGRITKRDDQPPWDKLQNVDWKTMPFA
jgi:hypothetical protein